MNIHAPTPSLVPHVCVCGQRDSDPTWHRVPVATVSPRRDEAYAITAPVVTPTEHRAVARRTDPGTSWEAARSVTGIRESQEEVLRFYQLFGPCTDEEAWREYTEETASCQPPHQHQSVSGFRTRRSELVARGLLRDTGERRRGSTGRRMIVWAAK